MATTLDMSAGLAVADVYAAALFGLARQQDRVDDVRSELAALVQLVADDADLRAFIYSDAIDDDAREASLERIFRGRLGDLTLDALQVLNRHGRITLLPALRRAFELRVEAARGEVEVLVRSATPLGAEQQQAVTRVAAELSGGTPVIRWEVAPGLLGGLVLQIGDRRYDNSLRRHLVLARERLLARTQTGAIDWSDIPLAEVLGRGASGGT